MKNITGLSSVLHVLLCPGLASATSLDELYRDIVRSDNQGYLPMFVKNRSIPDVLIEEEILRQIPENQESQPKKTFLIRFTFPMTGTLRKLPVWLQFSVGKMLLKLSKKTALRLSSWKLSTITLQKRPQSGRSAGMDECSRHRNQTQSGGSL